MTSTDFTNAETKTWRILDSDGETAGEAPGIDARQALEAFNRDALDGEGAMIYSEENDEWGLNHSGDHFTAYRRENAEQIADRIARNQDLHALEVEYTTLENAMMGRTTDATRELLTARLTELRLEIIEAAKATPAASKSPDERVVDFRMSESMLHYEENLGDAVREMWLIATEHAEAEYDQRPDTYTIATRVSAAIEQLVFGTDEEAKARDTEPAGPSNR